MVAKPYIQIKIYKFIIRLFYSKDKSLYKWHFDKQDRVVLVLPLGRFKFQYENELPFKLTILDSVAILKGEYHRVIKESGVLLTLIIEDN